MIRPVLPATWSASYTSWWEPMREGDRLTSGHVWFDDRLGAHRIDGVLNPWDERAHGKLLWRSEINLYEKGVCHQWDLGYALSTTSAGEPCYLPGEIVYRCIPSPGSIAPPDLLERRDARPAPALRIRGIEAEAWTFTRDDGKEVTWYFAPGTRRLLRMVMVWSEDHTLVRDLLAFHDDEVPRSVFRIAPPSFDAEGSHRGA